MKLFKTFSRLIFLIPLLLLYNNGSASPVLDSLLQKREIELDTISTDGLIMLDLAISSAYSEAQEYIKAQEFAEKALQTQNEKEYFKYEGEIYFKLAYSYDWQNNYIKALEYYDLCLEALNKPAKKNIALEGQAYGRKAGVYKNQGNYELSYENQLLALTSAEALNDSIKIASSLYHLGSLFFYQNQFDKALEYYQQAQIYANSKGGGSDRLLYACLAALGTTYEGLGLLEKALEYNEKSLRKAFEIDYKTGKAYALSNMGSTYMVLEEYEKAYDNLTRSLTLKRELKDKWGMVGTLRSLANLFIEKDDPKAAIPYLEEAQAIAKEIGSKPRQLEILDYFSKAYKEMGDYKKAYEYKDAFTILKDSVLNETTLEKMGKLTSDYEIYKKENEIKLLKKDKDVLEKEKLINQLYYYIWAVLVLSFGGLLLLFISRYRTQKRSSELLTEKNEEINRQNGELQKINTLLSDTNQLLEENKAKIEDQNKALESSNEDLRNFASVASHDLKEPLRMINSYTSILKKRYDSLFDERAKEYMGFVIDGVIRMEQLLNGLLDYSRVSIRGNENYKLINSKDIIDMVKGNLRFPIIKNSATINVEAYEEFPIIRANQVQMIQLFQNLISNAIKFRGERLPVITIGFDRKGDFYTFYIKDNGIGISKENQEKVFEMLTRLHTKEEYEGTGIGLATVRKIVERHKGKIWVESTEGEGSTFFFTLPVVKATETVLASTPR